MKLQEDSQQMSSESSDCPWGESPGAHFRFQQPWGSLQVSVLGQLMLQHFSQPPAGLRKGSPHGILEEEG